MVKEARSFLQWFLPLRLCAFARDFLFFPRAKPQSRKGRGKTFFVMRVKWAAFCLLLLDVKEATLYPHPMETIIILLIAGVICGFIGMGIGDLNGKNNGNKGFLLGFLLGPIGCIIAALLPPDQASAAPAAAPAKPDAQQTISMLEAQLAELKRNANPDAKSLIKAPSKPRTDEGTIPTYKLD
jgi:uncharacterized membrane protein YeaQ/YmgE (transglycosylase-associated protein family)